jgi:hypothetical protein
MKLDDGWAVLGLHLGCNSFGSGRLKDVGSFSVASLEEVTVDVVGGPDGGVSEALGDHIGVLAGGDQ